ncbi:MULTISPECIES: Lacal_2735 family protein [unclassified Olleya]|uniref:Lacal_2735 family protein n=1 Tax=unclassified Olleya TaxID=2615019 RepID=UPI0012FD3615|nr:MULTISPECIES: Lacal_2735 family protein [unclassified Olleya]QXP59137.1 Lacal_2735 family protein [Olleya sp. HaHaR_3_96]
MFGLFKKKSALDKLQDQYKKLLEESYKLSTTNRSESDKKQAEAQVVLEQIEAIQKTS